MIPDHIASFIRSQRPSLIADVLFGTIGTLVLVVCAPQAAWVLFQWVAYCAGTGVCLVLVFIFGHWLRSKLTKE